MHRARKLFAVGMVLLATLTVIACGSSEEKAKKEAEAKTAADWSSLQQKRQELDAKRQEYWQIRDQLDDATPAADGTAMAPDLEARVNALKAEVDSLTDAFGQQIADFINSQGIEIGGQLTEIQKQALHFNSDEAIVNARDYIEKAGDWQRALDIYQGAKAFDPDYDTLNAAIAHAEQMRFMTEERFAQATKKMSRKEVRKTLGPVKVTNIREFPDRNVVGWFYPKEDGGAAGVYFRERHKGQDDWEVYSVDFNAVKPAGTGGGGDVGETSGAPAGT